ncbi:hydroxyneurosporene methyltransferase [Rhizobium sp. L9]|uniref:methyltransferase n=1 Tax=Rhizobium sp. L9 TaxID=1340738 RepID=UPI000BEA9F28|nr:methyltransferase [Rhizobium sp. L9]PDT31050.1 hydroxyneurosporene methyltransferase [Rhizobium sp. L9]
MNVAVGSVTDLIFGRWKSQILYAGVALNVFDHLDLSDFKSGSDLAAELAVEPELLTRLLRSLAALGLLVENEERRFALSENGNLLRSNVDGSLRYMALLEEGPEHYAIWSHLVPMIRDGKQNAFVREYGQMAFEYAHTNADYGSVFRRAMSSFSTIQSALALEALRPYDFTKFHKICDVAGGQGHLACSLLQANPHLTGTVLDLPEVVADTNGHWAPRMGLSNRCDYVSGNMFEDVPDADAYFLKMILHDWNDDECVTILANLRRRVSNGGKVFIVEHVVPATSEPHFAKLYDIHMMCWGSGKERTEGEYRMLLERAGWSMAASYYPESRLMGVVEGTAV